MVGEDDTWDLYEDAQGKWHWRRVAYGGQIVGASHEEFSSRTMCEFNARRNGMDGCKDELRDIHEDTFEFYQDIEGKWFWRRFANNGKVVGASYEGYIHKSSCETNARRHCWDT